MSDVVVVDASIVLKLVLGEPDSADALALLDEWIARGVSIIAPVLLTYEVANILHQRVRGGQMSFERARAALGDILLQEIELDCPSDIAAAQALSERAMDLAHQFGLKATYDPHYLALAERKSCDYWTADQRLWNAVKAALPWVRWLGERALAP